MYLKRKVKVLTSVPNGRKGNKMEFEFTGTFYIAENDLQEMCEMCRKTNCTPQEALNVVSEGWDDCDFYLVGLVEQQIIKEIEKRLL